MEGQVVPAPRRAMARVAFIRTLAKHTTAIRDLRAWRLPLSALDSEHERALREMGMADRHLFSVRWGSVSRAMLFDVAGADRVDGAGTWSRHWKLDDAPWLHKWAVFALLQWDIGRSCTVPDCPQGCMAARADDDMDALQLVLTPDVMLTFGEERNHLVAMLEALDAAIDLRSGPAPTEDEMKSIADATFRSGTWLPIEQRPVVAPLPGPHPLLETKDEFLARARQAWDKAVAVLADEGVSLSAPRKLELHCEWLVRYHVRGETAAEILKDFEDGDTFRDASTVYKALRSMADLIELPPRSPSTNT